MAIPVPHTWTAGEKPVTSANMQTLTDAILYWSGATTSTGVRKPNFRGRQTSIQSIPNGTWTAVTFDAEDVDYGNNHVTTVGLNDKFTATDPGRHRVSGGCGFASNSTGRRGVRYTVNGTAIDGSQSLIAAASGAMSVAGRTLEVYLNAGDILRLEVFQDATGGGALNTAVSGDVEPDFNVVLVSN